MESFKNEKNTSRFLLKRYQVAYLENQFDNIDIVDIKLAINRGEKRVLCYDLNRNVYIMFKSAAEFIREYKVSKKTVTVMLLKSNVRVYKNLLFIYFNNDNKQKLINFVNSLCI